MRVSATCCSASEAGGGPLRVVPSAPEQVPANQLASTPVGVEHVGDGHLLGEAGAASGGLECVEEGAFAAGERLREVREGGFPEVPCLLVEREIGRRDVVGWIHPGPLGRRDAPQRGASSADIVPSARKVHTRLQAGEDER